MLQETKKQRNNAWWWKTPYIIARMDEAEVRKEGRKEEEGTRGVSVKQICS
jgi:hypothetical protein